MIKEFLIGCCYYPEHWDENNLKTDLLRIKDLGFNTVRMREFSWSIDENLEEAVLGKYKMYLNHGNRAVKVSGYDLLKECQFDEIEPYGVVLVDENS